MSAEDPLMDLDVRNYDYPELLSLFQIQLSDPNKVEVLSSTENRSKVDNKMHVIEDIVDDKNIVDFYRQARKILMTVFHMIDIGQVSSFYETKFMVEKIKATDGFLLYDVEELSDKILNRPNYNNKVLQQVQRNNQTTNGRASKDRDAAIQNTYPNKIAPGQLNPVKRITQIQNLNLNSCFRHNYYQSNPTNFLYMLPNEIKNVVSMRLVSIELPNSWYLFSSAMKNNVFFIEVTQQQLQPKATTSYKIIIPDGNYDSDSLQYFLNNNYFYESSLATDLKNIKFSIDQYSFKTSFELLSDTITISLKFVDEISQNIMNTCGWIFGYRLASYLNVTESVQSEGLFDGGGDRYVYVSINDYQYNNNTLNTVCFDKSTLNEDVLAKIQMVNGKLSLVVNDNNCPRSKVRQYTGPVHLSKLHIKLLDKFGSVIDLNHMDYSITIEF